MRILSLLLIGLLSGCMGMPDGVTPVDNFNTERYLGTWYEVARLDHSFERGLVRVSAEYQLREDGGIRVLNRGVDAKSGEVKEAEGKAYFVNHEQEAYLKVSFFGPFYGSYVVFELDDDYQHAFVSGYNHDYLWLLARDPAVSPALKAHFVSRAQELGFATDGLIWLDQR
ncbi:apolipoprotein D and lipocalin family protein [Oceanisphaera litoralis]|uniref:lipocalin family protein n=1 Tax=Oceanisphaera litoralis TaxID=225144 RepID=UPI00195B5633|nr:lipocalin family protein [Oceanisphaera litoralis]MBM7456959.1 apolipoprotein D and lipocalin family protein [Oceanisphaera litoralis]